MNIGVSTLCLLVVVSPLWSLRSTVNDAVEVSTEGRIVVADDEAGKRRRRRGKRNGETGGCGPVVSFIISVNSEMVKLTGGHLLSMFVDALHPVKEGQAGLSFKSLQENPANLSHFIDPAEVVQSLLDQEKEKTNWAKVRSALAERNVNVVIFACQECGSGWLGSFMNKLTGRAADSLVLQHTPLALLADENRLGKDFRILGTQHMLTMTKAPNIWTGNTHSMMFIGGLARNTFCPDLVVEKEKITPSIISNKGAVVLYLTTPEVKIAYAGTHLDAKDPEIRLSNIQLISETLQASQAHSWFVFGDLNYRLTAPLYSPLVQRECRDCLRSKQNLSQQQSWCHDSNSLGFGQCMPGSLCPKGLAKTSGAERNCAKIKEKADFDAYFSFMFKTHQRKGHEPNNLYNDLAKYDTLQYHLDDWVSRGFWKPDFSANVLPTYTINIPGQWYYHLQRAFETGTVFGAAGSKLENPEALHYLASQAYATSKDGFKKCETVETAKAFPESSDAPASGRCINFGWLDRLMIGGPQEDAEGGGVGGLTKVNEYRTLKILPPFYAGDHVPLYMLLTTAT